jgi:hypothetical protein
MNHRTGDDRKTDDYWGIVLLELAQDARDDGDVETAELLTATAMRYFGEADRLVSCWRKIEAGLDEHDLSAGRSRKRRAA